MAAEVSSPAESSRVRAVALEGGGWSAPRIVFVLAAVLSILTLLPYAYAHLTAPPGQTFMGFFFLGDDANTYLAKMREGWEGAWVWTNRYTTEASPPVYFFLWWIALGQLAALLHVPLLGMFHLVRVVGAFGLLYASWIFIEHFVEGAAARRFAIVFLATGLGLGYVLQALGKPVVFGAQTDTLDWRMPELSAFYSILALPHFVWAAAFQALGAVLTLRAVERGDVRLGLLGGLAWLGEASIHPQMPILLAGAVGIAILFRRPAGPAGWMAALVAFAVPAPYIAYSYFAFLGNPEVTRWSSQWRNNLPPDVVSLAMALLPQLVLAAFAIPLLLRRRSRNDVFLLAWLVLLAVILWLPNPAGNLRRRFFDGVYLPLVVMAARGMYEVLLPRLRGRARGLVPFAYASFATIASCFLLLGPFLVAGQGEYSLPTADYRAIQWLGGRPAGVVLSSSRLGLYIPAYTPDTVYVGQYSETYNWSRKTVEVHGLMNGQGDIANWARDHSIRYVVWSPADASGAPPASLGTPVYSAAGTFVFALY